MPISFGAREQPAAPTQVTSDKASCPLPGHDSENVTETVLVTDLPDPEWLCVRYCVAPSGHPSLQPGTQISNGRLRLFATQFCSSPPLLVQVSWLLQLLQELLDGVVPQRLSVPVGSSTDISHAPRWALRSVPAAWERRGRCLLPLLSSLSR